MKMEDTKVVKIWKYWQIMRIIIFLISKAHTNVEMYTNVEQIVSFRHNIQT